MTKEQIEQERVRFERIHARYSKQFHKDRNGEYENSYIRGMFEGWLTAKQDENNTTEENYMKTEMSADAVEMAERLALAKQLIKSLLRQHFDKEFVMNDERLQAFRQYV